MRLRPELIGQTLNLYAYSYADREFDSIRTVLRNSEVEFSSENVPFDSKRRRGVKYSIYGQRYIKQLEDYLQIKFFGSGGQTNVQIGGGNNAYRCLRITDTNDNEDCQTLYADNDHSAFFKCTLLANEKNWMGGSSEPGTCDV